MEYLFGFVISNAYILFRSKPNLQKVSFSTFAVSSSFDAAQGMISTRFNVKLAAQFLTDNIIPYAHRSKNKSAHSHPHYNIS